LKCEEGSKFDLLAKYLLILLLLLLLLFFLLLPFRSLK
jgi:hypothetical protein